MNFVELYLKGSVPACDIDKFVEAWHEWEVTDLDLHEYLGLSWDEYTEWVFHPSKLSEILSRRNK